MTVDETAYREAYDFFLHDPLTVVMPCGRPERHDEHLWRHVDDEAPQMKRCTGEVER